MISVASLVVAPKVWTLVVGGDLMLNAITPKSQPLAAVKKLFSQADVAYANLEIPLTTAKTVTPRKSAADIKARNQFVLKADPGHINSLTGLGIDIVSLANNHAMDYGIKGLNQMLGLLNRAGIKHNGAGKDRATANKVAVFRNRAGIRVGLLSYLAFVGDKAMYTCFPATEKGPGIAILGYQGQLNKTTLADLRGRIESAKAACDLLIVAPHWGEERAQLPRDWQIQLGRAMVDAGADAVIGAHPHVLQGSETYRGVPIHYSLGNLISPRPAATGVYRLTFRGTKYLSTERFPAVIGAGKLTLLQGKAATNGAAIIKKLDAKLTKRARALFPKRTQQVRLRTS